MTMMNPQVDLYLQDGCGRCPLGKTPACKVNHWQDELKLLREIVSECSLNEEVKWGSPCYTYKQKNLVMIGVLKECCIVSFFSGALLSDPHNLLQKPGENTQSARTLKFQNIEQITGLRTIIKEYILEAIEVEKSGKKVEFKKPTEWVIPIELEQKFEQMPALKEAFRALTSGRQRAYLLYFSAAKQAKTRDARIDKYVSHILNGRGMYD